MIIFARRSAGRIPFGAVPPKVLRGFPDGKIRVKLRPDCFPVVYVRNADGIRQFIPQQFGEAWEPGIEQARNITAH